MTAESNEWTVATSRADLLARIISLDERHKVMFESLRDLTLTGLAAQKENVAAALVPVKEALVQARSENDKRFDDLRKEADARDRAMSDKLDALTLAVTAAQASSSAAQAAQQDGKARGQWSFTAIISVLAVIAVVAVAIIQRAWH